MTAAGIREGNLFSLCFVLSADYESVCGGKIGASNKVCIRKDCNTATHQRHKFKWPDLVKDELGGYFIDAGGGKGENPSTLFATPTIGSAQVDAQFAGELLVVKRTLESW